MPGGGGGTRTASPAPRKPLATTQQRRRTNREGDPPKTQPEDNRQCVSRPTHHQTRRDFGQTEIGRKSGRPVGHATGSWTSGSGEPVGGHGEPARRSVRQWIGQAPSRADRTQVGQTGHRAGDGRRDRTLAKRRLRVGQSQVEVSRRRGREATEVGSRSAEVGSGAGVVVVGSRSADVGSGGGRRGRGIVGVASCWQWDRRWRPVIGLGGFGRPSCRPVGLAAGRPILPGRPFLMWTSTLGGSTSGGLLLCSSPVP